MAATSLGPGITPTQAARTVSHASSVSRPHDSATSTAIPTGTGAGEDSGDKQTGDGGTGSRIPGGIGRRGRRVGTKLSRSGRRAHPCCGTDSAACAGI